MTNPALIAPAPSADAEQPAEPSATDDLRLRMLGVLDAAWGTGRRKTINDALDLIERLEREIARWNELHRVIAEELDCDTETWPDHRNAPLAIGATFVLIKQRAERAEADRDALRECVKAADAMYALAEHTCGVSGRDKCNVVDDYLAARAKVKP